MLYLYTVCITFAKTEQLPAFFEMLALKADLVFGIAQVLFTGGLHFGCERITVLGIYRIF